MNILILSGPSRSGKSALVPILAAIHDFEVPHGTPDLDWYSDAYTSGDININVFCRLAVNYMSCYSWYGHLGRNINIRPSDYYSYQNLNSKIDLHTRHARNDNDSEFLNFIRACDSKKNWNTFQCELPIDAYELINLSYPINIQPIFCYRNPLDIFTSWISSNRIERSRRFSRMFKYESTKFLNSDPLSIQFSSAKNDSQITYNTEIGAFEFNEKVSNRPSVAKFEEDYLIDLLSKNRKQAQFWTEKRMLVHFERVASEPEYFVEYLRNRFNCKFDPLKLKEAICYMNKRPLEKLINQDSDDIGRMLQDLGVSPRVISFIKHEQENYVEELDRAR